MTTATHDVVAIGIGPFNLGLACLVDPIAEIDAVFLERKDGFDWHPGMLLDDSTLQVPFMADMVSLADPTSRFSYLNYLKESDRLYSFYIRESFFPLRVEYNAYCRWVAEQLDTLRFGRQVDAVEYDERDETYAVHTIVTSTGERETYRGRNLVLGTGTPPFVPECCRDLPGDAIHSSGYLDAKATLQTKGSVTLVGSGQSAAEIYHDLLGDIDRHGYDLTWVTRSPRFFPLEYTKLTLEMTSPEYVDYFYGLPSSTRERLGEAHKGLYKGIDSELINAIFDLLYQKNLHGPCPTTLYTNTAVRDAWRDDSAGAYVLELCQVEQERGFTHTTEGLVFATGYRYEIPDFLAPITDRIAWDAEGRFAVRRDYCIGAHGSTIYVQNAELHTHGFAAPDLGMAAYRNSCIIRALLGREHYPIERRIAFQDFAAPSRADIARLPGADAEVAQSRRDEAGKRRNVGGMGVGAMGVRELDPAVDAELLHRWVTHPKAEFWQMREASVADVAAFYAGIAANPHHDAFVGIHDGSPAFLMERYDPAHDVIGKVYDVEPGDVGMHFLVAPTEQPIRGFTRAVIGTVMDFLFADPEVRRVVVEPDVRNHAVHTLNAAVGFRVVDTVALPDKEALLSICTRAEYERARSQ